VGPTGAGKTTLASLLIRFYDPASGRVTLDGHDLRDLAVQTLRQNIALVLQEPILFSGTILDNIAYGRPGAAVEEVVTAARAANAHDFIMALSNGYASEVGERGVRLSGGERQRLCVARAFLMDAPVLILDEPTSAIDSRTEQVIIDALDRLMVGRTTFIIAHRLSTIRRADQILVLDEGRVMERGTHAQLLNRGGLYAELYRIQTRGLRRDKERDAKEVRA
jgi:ABC-type multidrug transport system fused ATPase/permease subunit